MTAAGQTRRSSPASLRVLCRPCGAADQGVADALESVLSNNTQARLRRTQWRIC